jgi:hypothetical protein
VLFLSDESSESAGYAAREPFERRFSDIKLKGVRAVTMTHKRQSEQAPSRENEWEAALSAYRTDAAAAIVAHRPSEDGHCAVCGDEMPCGAARCAELILEL